MTQLKSRQNSAEQVSMKTQSAEWKFLMTTAFLVAMVAVPTFASLFSDDGMQVGTLVLRANNQKMRQPASLPHLNGPKKHLVIKDAGKELNNLLVNNEIQFDFRCTKTKKTEFEIQGTFVQLKGQDCGKNAKMPKINITNKTNGFTASVFATSEKEYQTDLIQLNNGINQIHIHYQSPLGQHEEHVLNVKAE